MGYKQIQDFTKLMIGVHTVARFCQHLTDVPSLIPSLQSRKLLNMTAE